MSTVEEVKQLRNNPIEFTEYAAKVMHAWNKKSGEECNIVVCNYKNEGEWLTYDGENHPMWDWYRYLYAVKEVPEQRPMTDKEAREFIFANWDKIIVSEAGFPTLVLKEHVIAASNITTSKIYCFIEDMDCEVPFFNSKWKKFCI